jgi:hypothetical protein
MRLLPFIALLLLTACATPPLRATFNELHRKPYALHVFDCSNKAGRYCRALREAGYFANVLVIKHPDHELAHTIVAVLEFHDPTTGQHNLRNPRLDEGYELLYVIPDVVLYNDPDFR